MRAELLATLSKLAPRIVTMAACSSAHYWCQRFKEMGIEVRRISPQYDSPFIKINKHDANDAVAIVEAADQSCVLYQQVR